jgi:hypothetical protein
MNIVIYARQDMQPLTVIDLPMRQLEMGAHRGVVRIEVMDPIDLRPMLYSSASSLAESARYHTVDLMFHRLVMLGTETFLITTSDEEFALLLKPDWLPGQRGRANQLKKERDQMAQALVIALTRGLGG